MNKLRILLSIIVFSGASFANASSISIDPMPGVTDGDTFTLGVDIDLSDISSMTQGGGFSLFFDASILNVTGVIFNSSVWNFLNQPGTIDNTAGSLLNVVFSAFPGASGLITNSITIDFLAVGPGTSFLDLQTTTLNPFKSDGQPMAITFVDSSQLVSPVPEPQTWLLMLAGLGIMGLGLRRKRSTLG